MKKTIISIVSILLFIGNTLAQNDTLYILKNGVVVTQFNISSDIDSIIFYKPELQTVTDIDSNVYKTVTIGNQVWMAENLKTTKLNDGTEIPFVTNNNDWDALYASDQPAYCWLLDDSSSYAQKCGAIYTWNTVNTGELCPQGWHVPDNNEWDTLLTYLTNNGYGFDKYHPNHVGRSMASTSEWLAYTSEGTVGNDLSKNNSSYFNGIPVPSRGFYGDFNYLNKYANWWSSTAATGASAGSAYYWFLRWDSSRLLHINATNHVGMSVRCLKDN